VHKLALVVAALLPALAQSQESAPVMPEDPRAPRFHEVERGFFTGFEVGYLTLFKTPTADLARHPGTADGGRSDGVLVGLTVGYDLGDRLALSAYALGATSTASVSYGAFSVLSLGGDVRLSLVGLRDRNGTERLRLYLHARGGWLVTRPLGLFGDKDLYFAGGPGLEYDTHLRHFSVGLAVDGAYVSKAGATGLAITPTVRYTF
jgi:hypothetical protein